MASYLVPICLFFAVLTIVSAVPADEKPFDCPPNEQYYKCELEVCYKSCEHLKRPPPCPAIAAGCFKPACECVAGYLRNSAGKCVPSNECS
ncbi:venom serine protease inhibitor [Helicoverpa armigera]|uniref:venom serine protease inhibitor n=1 Tax=Helicoverpa armigera TaxID=29058 RepID=UPI0030830000